MSFFELTSDEKSRLQRLNHQKELVFALKKLFLSVCVNEPPSNESIKKVARAFQELSIINPDNQAGAKEENLV